MLGFAILDLLFHRRLLFGRHAALQVFAHLPALQRLLHRRLLCRGRLRRLLQVEIDRLGIAGRSPDAVHLVDFLAVYFNR